MPLLRNGSFLSGNPGSFRGGSYLGVMRSQWSQPGSVRGFYIGDGTSVNGVAKAAQSSIPAGYPAGEAWALAQKAGGMATYTMLTADGGVSAAMAAGINMESTLTGSGGVTGALGLIVSLFATIIADADISPLITGAANLAASLAAAGDVTAAASALANIEAQLSGGGNATATVSALANMQALVSTEGLVVTGNPAALASAVWEFLISSGLTAKDALRRTAPTKEGAVVADLGNSRTAIKTDLTETEVNHWERVLVCFSTGTLAGQLALVSAYDPVTSVLTLAGTGFSSIPTDGDSFVLINR